MRGLARLDRLLDRGQHLRREISPQPPVMMEKMLADTSDAHATSSLYQLPDAPPPPKLPPPPLKPPRPRTGGPAEAKLSANIEIAKMTTPAKIDAASDPTASQASNPMMP